MVTTRVFAQVKDVTGESSYYTVPNDLETECYELNAALEEIIEKNMNRLGAWAFVASIGSIGEEVLYTAIDNKTVSLSLVIAGIFAIAISGCITYRKLGPYKETKQELDLLIKKIAQEVFNAQGNFQGDPEIEQDIRRISPNEISSDSLIISVSSDKSSITLKWASSHEMKKAAQNNVLLNPVHELKWSQPSRPKIAKFKLITSSC